MITSVAESSVESFSWKRITAATSASTSVSSSKGAFRFRMVFPPVADVSNPFACSVPHRRAADIIQEGGAQRRAPCPAGPFGHRRRVLSDIVERASLRQDRSCGATINRFLRREVAGTRKATA